MRRSLPLQLTKREINAQSHLAVAGVVPIFTTEYADREAFGRKCLMNVASAAKFSSDRTIRQYAEEIRHVKPTKL